MSVPNHIQKAINRDLPVEIDGFILYPVLVEELEEFKIAMPTLTFMQQSLPVALASMTLMQALFKLDYISRTQTGESAGYTLSMVAMLILSLRIRQGEVFAERIKDVKFICEPNDESALKFIVLKVNGEEEKLIKPLLFNRMREIIAEQNAVELIGADENPDLIEAEQDIAQAQSVDLEEKFEDLLTTMSVLENVEEADIYKWTLRKFKRRRMAHDRIMRYQMCGMAEMNGAKWKKGNPCPSMFYNRSKVSNALINVGSFLGGAAEKTIKKEIF